MHTLSSSSIPHECHVPPAEPHSNCSSQRTPGNHCFFLYLCVSDFISLKSSSTRRQDSHSSCDLLLLSSLKQQNVLEAGPSGYKRQKILFSRLTGVQLQLRYHVFSIHSFIIHLSLVTRFRIFAVVNRRLDTLLEIRGFIFCGRAKSHGDSVSN